MQGGCLNRGGWAFRTHENRGAVKKRRGKGKDGRNVVADVGQQTEVNKIAAQEEEIRGGKGVLNHIY